MSPDDEIGKSTALSNNVEEPKTKINNFPNLECLKEDQASNCGKLAIKKTSSIKESKEKSETESDYSEESSVHSKSSTPE